MRIRKCASRLLGSAYPAAQLETAPRFELPLPLPPPPPPPPPFAEPILVAHGSHAGGGAFAATTASGESCELNRSPWDLFGELGLSDPQEEDLVEQYIVPVAFRAGWLFTAGMPAASAKEEEQSVAVDKENSAQPRHEVVKKPRSMKPVVKKEKKESKPKKKAKLKKDDGGGLPAPAGEAQVWTCKKTDGKRWHCRRPVSQPNSLCDYHAEQKRAYYNVPSDHEPGSLSAEAVVAASSAASKPSTITKSKPRRKKKKHLADACEEYYYYEGFGLCRNKRQYIESAPAEQEEEALPEDHADPTEDQAEADDTGHLAAARDTVHRTAACDEDPIFDDIAGIAGGHEDSSDDMHGCNGDGNGDIKRTSPLKKRWRKRVKARSLKSLM